MTTGPPPKMTVPARYMLANRSRARGGVVSWPLATRMPMNEAIYVVRLGTHFRGEESMSYQRREPISKRPPEFG